MTGSFAQRLREAAQALTSERVSVAALAEAHGPAAHGSLMLLMAVPCLLPIPGTGTVLGFGLAAIAWAMWRGQHESLLPGKVAELEMSGRWARRVLVTLAAIYGLAARFARARLSHLTGAGVQGLLAAVVGAMALVLVLPIPFGNVLPAVALILIGLGLVFRDGVAVVLGLLTAASTLAVLVGLSVAAAVWGGEWVSGLLA